MDVHCITVLCVTSQPWPTIFLLGRFLCLLLFPLIFNNKINLKPRLSVTTQNSAAFISGLIFLPQTIFKELIIVNLGHMYLFFYVYMSNYFNKLSCRIGLLNSALFLHGFFLFDDLVNWVS